MLKECEKPLERVYLLSEDEIREEIRRLLWELDLSRLLSESGGANDVARDLTIQIADRLGELRPIKKTCDFLVTGPDANDLIIRIMEDGEFTSNYGTIEANYNPKKRIITLRLMRINCENYLSYVYDSLMHEYTHTLQFRNMSQLTKYQIDTSGVDGSLSKEIGYGFNPYEIGSRIGSADFFFRSFIEGTNLNPDELRNLPYQTIAKKFKNSLLIDEMQSLLKEVEQLDVCDENAEELVNICSKLTQGTKDKARNIYQRYCGASEVSYGARMLYVSKLKELALKDMRKLFKDYTDRLQKMWEHLVADYIGGEFKSYYVNQS